MYIQLATVLHAETSTVDILDGYKNERYLSSLIAILDLMVWGRTKFVQIGNY